MYLSVGLRLNQPVIHHVPDTLRAVEQVDKALLEAKRSGKNRIYLVGKPQSDIADIK